MDQKSDILETSGQIVYETIKYLIEDNFTVPMSIDVD